jgi:hypothetical protein
LSHFASPQVFHLKKHTLKVHMGKKNVCGNWGQH